MVTVNWTFAGKSHCQEFSSIADALLWVAYLLRRGCPVTVASGA